MSQEEDGHEVEPGYLTCIIQCMFSASYIGSIDIIDSINSGTQTIPLLPLSGAKLGPGARSNGLTSRNR